MGNYNYLRKGVGHRHKRLIKWNWFWNRFFYGGGSTNVAAFCYCLPTSLSFVFDWSAHTLGPFHKWIGDFISFRWLKWLFTRSRWCCQTRFYWRRCPTQIKLWRISELEWWHSKACSKLTSWKRYASSLLFITFLTLSTMLINIICR